MQLIEFLAKFDIIEIMVSGYKRMTVGGSKKLVIDRNCGRSGREIQDMLAGYGVQIWGRGFTSDTWSFRVKNAQVSWAEYLCWQNGLTVVSPPIYDRNRGYFDGNETDPGTQTDGVTAAHPDFIDWLLGGE